MATKTPVKCANDAHRPFAADDTVPPAVVGASLNVLPGNGITIVINPDGTIRLINTCCG